MYRSPFSLLKVTDPFWKNLSNRRREKASFFPPHFLLLCRLMLNLIKMISSDCMRGELLHLNTLLSSDVPVRLDRQSAHLSTRSDTVTIQKWIWGNVWAVYQKMSSLAWSHLAAGSRLCAGLWSNSRFDSHSSDVPQGFHRSRLSSSVKPKYSDCQLLSAKLTVQGSAQAKLLISVNHFTTDVQNFVKWWHKFSLNCTLRTLGHSFIQRIMHLESVYEDFTHL